MANKLPLGQQPKNITDIFSSMINQGWGGDGLSRRMDEALYNIGLTFCKFKGHYEVFQNCFELFDSTRQNISKLDIPSISVEYLYVRSFAALLGAVTMASGGLLTESITLTRSMLENAVYANYIHRQPSMESVWLNRNKNDESEKACRGAFKWIEVIKHIEPSQLQENIHIHYKKCIDLGAHPNPYASGINLKLEDGLILSSIIHGDPIMKSTVMTCIGKAAFDVLGIYCGIYPNTFQANDFKYRLENLQALLSRLTQEMIEANSKGSQ
jgi:hypothetical protein